MGFTLPPRASVKDHGKDSPGDFHNTKSAGGRGREKLGEEEKPPTSKLTDCT